MHGPNLTLERPKSTYMDQFVSDTHLRQCVRYVRPFVPLKRFIIGVSHLFDPKFWAKIS